MAAENEVIGVHSVESRKELIQKGTESKKLCGPCRFIAPILAEIAKKTPEVIFLKVDIDELKSVAEEWSVEAMPTFLFLKEGKEVDKVVGAKKEELQLAITKHATAVATA
ncbi:unnamed protein product [Vicia faba]|uniref:Thioredoxin domain-containing protein n=1 Tax=Vicia faba TaxID=3906 RepID=A0AAV1AAS1_VICFA|nr:unnamed protein product [Vicia faba]